MPPLSDLSDEELWYWLRLCGARIQALLETFQARYPFVPEFQLDIWNQMRACDGWKATEDELRRWKGSRP